jgi:membrane protein HdeD
MSLSPGTPSSGPERRVGDLRGGEPGTGRRRTGWDVALGVLLIIGALGIFGDVTLATTVSVSFLGWLTVISGVILFAGALRRVKSGGLSASLPGGVGLVVLGLFILRNPLIGAFSITLLAGALFLTMGVVRVVTSGQFGPDRWLLVASGLISAGLGLFVLLNVVAATPALIGTLLGAQVLLEGMTLLVAGRTYYIPTPRAGETSTAP